MSKWETVPSDEGWETIRPAVYPETSVMQDIGQGVGNLAAGAIRGAGSIGATLLTPYDLAVGNTQSIGNPERRQDMDAALQSLGAEPESMLYKGGKIGGEIAGTFGTGGVWANLASKIPGATPAAIQAFKTWGMSTGLSPTTFVAKFGNAALRTAVGTIVGGTAGALIDPESAKTSATIGGIAATVLPPVVSGAGRVASAVKASIYPSPGNIAVRAAGPQVDDVIRELERTRSAVPGVNLTAGQAGVGGKSAEFSALDRLLATDRAPSAALVSKGQQEAARLTAAQGIGGTPKQLADKVAYRTITSFKNYEAAKDVAVVSDTALEKIMANPFFKKEVLAAKELVRAANLQRVSDGLPPRQSLTEYLHFVKEGLDTALQAGPATGGTALSGARSSAASKVKNDLVAWLGKNNPLYDDARLAHIAMSKPINQMRVGQELERALVAPGTGAERSTAFSAKVRAAETKISKGSGRPQLDALTSDQRKVIEAIEADFARNAAYKESYKIGAGTSLERRIGAPVVPPTGMFQPVISAARSWVNKGLGTGYEKGLERLAPFRTNPAELARQMRNATPTQKKIMEAWLEKYASVSMISGAQPSTGMMTNLATEEQ